MFPTAFRSFLVAVLTAVPALAQKTLQAHSGDNQRTDTVHLVISMDGGKFAGLPAAAFLSYVPAEWKSSMTDAKIDELTKGHLFRLGMNNWATLDNSVPISFGNVTVPVGIWYLGVARDSSGSKWTLAFIDPAKCKAAGVVPPMADKAPRAYEVVLPIEKATDVVEKMSVKLAADAKDPTKGTFSIAFGNLKTSVSYELKLAPVADAAGTGPKKN